MLDEAFRDVWDGVYTQLRQSADLFNVANVRAKTKTSRILMIELLFADDSALVSHSAEETDAFSYALRKFGLKINIKKTEELTNPTLQEPEWRVLWLIETSGTLFWNSPTSEALYKLMDNDIQKRMAKASAYFGRLRQRFWHNQHVSLRVKGNI